MLMMTIAIMIRTHINNNTDNNDDNDNHIIAMMIIMTMMELKIFSRCV